MTVRKIDPKTAHDGIHDGKPVLIDGREPDEDIKELTPEAHLVPLSGFNTEDFRKEHEKIAVIHGMSGGRTGASAPRILQTGYRDVHQLDGGIEAWQRAGLPVNENAKAPISIMGQVEITAGLLILLGVVLLGAVNPWFIVLSAVAGVGAAQAEITGTCMMALILKHMPWNRVISGHQRIAATA